MEISLGTDNITEDEYKFIMTAYELMTMAKCKRISREVREFVAQQLNDIQNEQ